MSQSPPSKRLPKRFYKEVSVTDTPDGWGVALDGRAMKTRGKSLLVVPTRVLAERIADEWQAQKEEIDQQLMPLSGLSGTAVDHGQDNRRALIEDVLGYAKSDLLCYRASDPNPLVIRQGAEWQPILDWAEEALGARLEVTAQLTVIEQPQASGDRLRAFVEALSDFEITALGPATSLLGSLILALALYNQHLDAPKALSASLLDELWQAEQWGEDDEARTRRAGLLRDLEGLERFFLALR